MADKKQRDLWFEGRDRGLAIAMLQEVPKIGEVVQYERSGYPVKTEYDQMRVFIDRAQSAETANRQYEPAKSRTLSLSQDDIHYFDDGVGAGIKQAWQKKRASLRSMR